MGHILLARGSAVDDACCKGDIVGMLHATLARADIADTVERIRAKVLFEERYDFLDMDKGTRHMVHLIRFGVHLYQDVTIKPFIGILP